MNRSRRKQLNPIDAPSLARWIVLAAFLALTGLIYVYLNVQLHHLGDRKSALEIQLANLRSEYETATVQKEALISYSALQRRWKEGYLKMEQIKDQDIVRLTSSPNPLAEDAIQPVVNQRSGR
ncbi:MAG: hypothetical protein ACR2HH_02975 [Chthoniobacterales bacterium]